jgi:RNA polymerase sigma factor (sigma-70 family)
VSTTAFPPLSVDAAATPSGSGPSSSHSSPQLRQQIEEAYRNEARKLHRYLRRQTDDDIASELVQEVFARTAASRQLTDLFNPAAYLRRVARNLLIERSRARKRQNAVFVPYDEEHDAGCAPEQMQELEVRELMQRYERAVASMSEKTRNVFLMHRVDERSYREIAEILGITIAGVEYHMTKALAHLAKRLGVTR